MISDEEETILQRYKANQQQCYKDLFQCKMEKLALNKHQKLDNEVIENFHDKKEDLKSITIRFKA